MSLLEISNLHTYFKTKKGLVKAVNAKAAGRAEGKVVAELVRGALNS